MLGNWERNLRLNKSKFYSHLGKFKDVPQNPKTLEEHLHLRRLEQGISLRQLGRQFNIYYKAIATWEKKSSPLPLEYRKRIVEFLGYDPENVGNQQ